MIKHKIFAKGDYIQALISTTQAPNVLIPVRAMIYDVKFDDVNPQYQIKIKKFYDTINFLKRNLFGGRFIKNFEGKDTRINLKRQEYNTVKELEDRVFGGEKQDLYMLCVDSVFCVKTRAEQIKLFNKIQDFQVESTIKALFNLSNRSSYTGNFKFHTKGEFVKALQKFLGDRYPNDDDWVDSVLYRPNHDEMDRGEWV
jgi:hypothetical protein|tara:strand:+ start:2283 stop:2879 length:597 start_codon:yes stop_codon:yes gene_type:complete